MIITLLVTLNFVKTAASIDVEASKRQHHRLLGTFASLLLHTWRPGRFNFPNRWWSHRITVQAILALKVMDFPIPISSIRRSKLPRRCPVPESVWSSSDVLVLHSMLNKETGVSRVSYIFLKWWWCKGAWFLCTPKPTITKCASRQCWRTKGIACTETQSRPSLCKIQATSPGKWKFSSFAAKVHH